MGVLGFPLGSPLGGGDAGIAPLLPQDDTALAYSDGLGALPQSDTGTDVSLLAGLNGSWQVVGGDAIMAEQLLRRITTDRGSLDFSPNDGMDVRDSVRADMTSDDVFQAKQSVENELLKDERVDDATVVATYDPQQQALQLDLTITKATGSFSLVVSVTALTVDLLSAEVV
jgi:hypothetical protein